MLEDFKEFVLFDAGVYRFKERFSLASLKASTNECRKSEVLSLPIFTKFKLSRNYSGMLISFSSLLLKAPATSLLNKVLTGIKK